MTENTTEVRKARAPRWHRIMLFLSGIILTILFLWLWSFMVADIGSVNMPQYEEVEKRIVSRELLDKRARLTKDAERVATEIQDLQQNQQLLSTSTSSARETMNQLLENQKRLAERNIQLSPAEQEAIGESQRLFLENQKQFQDLNTRIVKLTDQQRELRSQVAQLDEQIEPMRKRANDEFQKELEAARLKAAAIKLAFLLPLLAVSTWLFIRKRRSTYGLLVYAFFISVALKVTDVMHQYFPKRYFKYVFLIALIAVVVALIIYLIKLITRPRREFLLKQFREAYEKQSCPSCDYPIQAAKRQEVPGGFRKKMILALPANKDREEMQPYSCPACGEQLYEKCSSCDHVRHSLLPYCEHCGAGKTAVEAPPPV